MLRHIRQPSLMVPAKSRLLLAHGPVPSTRLWQRLHALRSICTRAAKPHWTSMLLTARIPAACLHGSVRLQIQHITLMRRTMSSRTMMRWVRLTIRWPLICRRCPFPRNCPAFYTCFLAAIRREEPLGISCCSWQNASRRLRL